MRKSTYTPPGPAEAVLDSAAARADRDPETAQVLALVGIGRALLLLAERLGEPPIPAFAPDPELPSPDDAPAAATGSPAGYGYCLAPCPRCQVRVDVAADGCCPDCGERLIPH